MIVAVVVLLAAYGAGCTRRDLGIDLDGGPDVRDLSTEAKRDLAGVDIGAFDLAQILSCNDRFGSLPDYVLCEETPSTCRFSFGNEQQKSSCGAACGASCQSEWEVDVASCDVGSNPPLTCTTNHHEVVCVCSR